MKRSTVIIGNGLGMAVKDSFFTLKKGMQAVWNDEDSLSADQKCLIKSTILKISASNPPDSEAQLNTLQSAIVATELLRKLEINDVHWLSASAKKLPLAFKKYIHSVASYFHNPEYEIPPEFATGLSNFITQSKSHVATLNYDHLLYNSFIKHKILDGKRGSLVDGFLPSGFDETTLDRKKNENHGWFLHLHGSPLFVGNKKLMRKDRESIDPNENNHIVLSYVSYKPMIIESSDILRSYWKYLDKAFKESDQIFLFGYSGEDKHLNDKINAHKDKSIRIVEWNGTGSNNDGIKPYDIRIQFWNDCFPNHEVELSHMQNILEFRNWGQNVKKTSLS